MERPSNGILLLLSIYLCCILPILHASPRVLSHSELASFEHRFTIDELRSYIDQHYMAPMKRHNTTDTSLIEPTASHVDDQEVSSSPAITPLQNSLGVCNSINTKPSLYIPPCILPIDPRYDYRDPVGYIPLYSFPDSDHYMIDMIVEEPSSTKLPMQRVVLSTRHDVTILFSQSVCGQNLQHCMPLDAQIVYKLDTPISFDMGNSQINCTSCFKAVADISIQFASNGHIERPKHRLGYVWASSISDYQSQYGNPHVTQIGPVRGVFGIAPPYSDTYYAMGQHRFFQQLLLQTLYTYPIDTQINDSVIITRYDYGLDLYKYGTNTVTSNRNKPFGVRNEQSKASRMYFNGVPEQFRSKIQWADYPLPVNTNMVSRIPLFIAYDISVCGVNMGNYIAIVDTLTSCLSLPLSLFTAVISWLPVQCSRVSSTGPQTCYVDRHQEYATMLPSFQFRLNESGSSYVSIPFDHLITPDRTQSGNQPLCLTYHDTPNNTIILGTIPLSALYMHFDALHNRVGMANKVLIQNIHDNSMLQCVPRLQCTGMDISTTAYNGCFQPQCSNYILFDYNPDNHQCELSISLYIVFAILIVGFIFVDALLGYQEESSRQKLKRTVLRVMLIDRNSRRTRNTSGDQDDAPSPQQQRQPSNDNTNINRDGDGDGGGDDDEPPAQMRHPPDASQDTQANENVVDEHVRELSYTVNARAPPSGIHLETDTNHSRSTHSSRSRTDPPIRSRSRSGRQQPLSSPTSASSTSGQYPSSPSHREPRRHNMGRRHPRRRYDPYGHGLQPRSPGHRDGRTADHRRERRDRSGRSNRARSHERHEGI